MSTDDQLGQPAANPPSSFDYSDWQANRDVLSAEPDDGPAKRAPWALVGAAGGLGLALVGGVTYAVGALSGGGSQPADARPSGALAAVTLGPYPSAGRKRDGFRPLRKFPPGRATVAGG